jgi:hypothetical protein
MRASTLAAVLSGLALLAAAPQARAAGVHKDPWAIDWTALPTAAAPLSEPTWNIQFGVQKQGQPGRTRVFLETGALLKETAILENAAQGARPRAVEYSDAYEARRKIHVYASVATLPLFVTEFILGQKLYNGVPTDALRSGHRVVAAGVAGLFGVNTVTGVWNLWEGRKDPNRRALRLAHGLLMLAADGGFVATGVLAPKRHRDGFYTGNFSLHRGVAVTSMAVATASYLMMLLSR